MPIPSIREIAKANTIEEIYALYAKYNWVKVMEFDWVTYDSRRGVWGVVRYRCDSSKLSCGCGERAILITKMSVGIIQTCVACAKATSGPISFDNKAFSVISVSRIEEAEAIRLLKNSGQISPIGADKRMKIQSRYDRFRELG